MHIKILIPAALALLLGACAAPEHLSGDFGNSYRINVAAQLANPGAENREHPLAASDGQKIEQALKDYRKSKPTAAARDHLITEASK
jgi:type IV pilus biogenesis protein CpaD/CtpE